MQIVIVCLRNEVWGGTAENLGLERFEPNFPQGLINAE
jgi:hypothetical protein